MRNSNYKIDNLAKGETNAAFVLDSDQAPPDKKESAKQTVSATGNSYWNKIFVNYLLWIFLEYYDL